VFSLGDIRIHCTVSIIQRSFSIFLCVFVCVFVVYLCEFSVRNNACHLIRHSCACSY